MPSVDAVVECPVYESFRVQQVAGMFDVPLKEKCTERFTVEVPDDTEEWNIGVIVGPSGSGKSTVARDVYGESLQQAADWPEEAAVIDGFGETSAKEVTHTLTAVGFSSPPSWIKPYRVLSNGEKFRCDLAKALLVDSPLIAFDEFTSVVDRTVAKIGSAAVSKAIRKGRIKKKFVAVSCHYDIVEWLEPDWVLDMSTCELTRGRLRRPEIKLNIFRCHHSAWRLFAKHHYLNTGSVRGSTCFMGLIEGQAVAFCCVLPLFGKKGYRRLSRTVVLPDFQGVGVGACISEAVGDYYLNQGLKVSAVTSHPAMIRYRSKSSKWKASRIIKPWVRATGLAKSDPQQKGRGKKTSAGRQCVSFRYIGPKIAADIGGPKNQGDQDN